MLQVIQGFHSFILNSWCWLYYLVSKHFLSGYGADQNGKYNQEYGEKDERKMRQESRRQLEEDVLELLALITQNHARREEEGSARTIEREQTKIRQQGGANATPGGVLFLQQGPLKVDSQSGEVL